MSQGDEHMKQGNYTGNSAKSLHVSIEASLKKLKTTYIDLVCLNEPVAFSSAITLTVFFFFSFSSTCTGETPHPRTMTVLNRAGGTTRRVWKK